MYRKRQLVRFVKPASPGTFRTAIVGFCTAALTIVADHFLKKYLPETITNWIVASVILIVTATICSWFWHRKSISRLVLIVGLLLAIAVSAPVSRVPVGIIFGLACIVWLALPRIAVWTEKWKSSHNEWNNWVDKHSAIQMIRDALLNNDRDYETDDEIRQRLADGIRNGILKGFTDRGGQNVRLSPENVDEALKHYDSSANFWSKGLGNLLKQIRRGL